MLARAGLSSAICFPHVLLPPAIYRPCNAPADALLLLCSIFAQVPAEQLKWFLNSLRDSTSDAKDKNTCDDFECVPRVCFVCARCFCLPHSFAPHSRGTVAFCCVLSYLVKYVLTDSPVLKTDLIKEAFGMSTRQSQSCCLHRGCGTVPAPTAC